MEFVSILYAFLTHGIGCKTKVKQSLEVFYFVVLEH